MVVKKERRKGGFWCKNTEREAWRCKPEGAVSNEGVLLFMYIRHFLFFFALLARDVKKIYTVIRYTFLFLSLCFCFFFVCHQ